MGAKTSDKYSLSITLLLAKWNICVNVRAFVTLALFDVGL